MTFIEPIVELPSPTRQQRVIGFEIMLLVRRSTKAWRGRGCRVVRSRQRDRPRIFPFVRAYAAVGPEERIGLWSDSLRKRVRSGRLPRFRHGGKVAGRRSTWTQDRARDLPRAV